MTPRVCRQPSLLASATGLALCAIALALSACSGEPAAAPAPTTSAPLTTGVPSSSAGSAQPSPAPPTAEATSSPAGPSASPTVPDPVVALTEQSTAARSVAPPAQVVTITSIAARIDGSTEQLVISTVGGFPGVTVQYVDVVRIDDEPVLTDGAAALEIVLQAADPNGAQGLAQGVSTELYPDQPLLKDVRLAQYLADTVTFAVGLSSAAPFTVTTTDTAVTITFYG